MNTTNTNLPQTTKLVSYAIGASVIYLDRNEDAIRGVITASSLEDNGDLAYAISGRAWFSPDEIVGQYAEASDESLAEIKARITQESGEEVDEEEAEEGEDGEDGQVADDEECLECGEHIEYCVCDDCNECGEHIEYCVCDDCNECGEYLDDCVHTQQPQPDA